MIGRVHVRFALGEPGLLGRRRAEDDRAEMLDVLETAHGGRPTRVALTVSPTVNTLLIIVITYLLCWARSFSCMQDDGIRLDRGSTRDATSERKSGLGAVRSIVRWCALSCRVQFGYPGIPAFQYPSIGHETAGS